MVLARFEKPIIDTAGNLITAVGFMFEVRREDVAGSPRKPIYSDRDGLSSLGNPASLVDGVVAFHAAGGPFSLRVYGTGYDETWNYLPIGTGGEADLDQLLIPGYLFEFETGTTAPPGDGCIRANNADLSLATRLYIWKSTIAGANVATRIAALLNKRVLLTSTNAGEQSSYQVDLVTDQTTYYELTLSLPVGATSIPAGRVGMQREGSEGPAGTNGVFNGTEVVFTGASETLLATQKGNTIICNRATAMALAIQAAATCGSTYAVLIKNDNLGLVTIDPNGAETIDGAATATLLPGEAVVLTCNGSSFRTLMRGYHPGGTNVALADGGHGADDAPGARTALGLVIGTDVLGPASQAQQETASSNAVAVTPGRQHFNPSAAKAWGQVTGAGSSVLTSSYNVTSITDNGNNIDVTIATDFSSANYAVVATMVESTTAGDGIAIVSGKAAGVFTLHRYDVEFECRVGGANRRLGLRLLRRPRMIETQTQTIAITNEDGSLSLMHIIVSAPLKCFSLDMALANGFVIEVGDGGEEFWAGGITDEGVELELQRRGKPFVSWRRIDKSELPADPMFRLSWVDAGKAIEVDPAKARQHLADRLQAAAWRHHIDLERRAMPIDDVAVEAAMSRLLPAT